MQFYMTPHQQNPPPPPNKYNSLAPTPKQKFLIPTSKAFLRFLTSLVLFLKPFEGPKRKVKIN